MPVYDLHNPVDLQNDLNHIIKRLNGIYNINMDAKPIEIVPKLQDTSNTFWASEENAIEFNKLIPEFKNLHKDMYSFIESFTSLATKKKYDYEPFEKKHINFKEFRLLNNMFKHPDKKAHTITFLKINHIDGKLFDLGCNFHFKDGSFKCIFYAEFVQLFLKILVDWKAIKWEKPSKKPGSVEAGL
jgi:hypothetical protein